MKTIIQRQRTQRRCYAFLANIRDLKCVKNVLGSIDVNTLHLVETFLMNVKHCGVFHHRKKRHPDESWLMDASLSGKTCTE